MELPTSHGWSQYTRQYSVYNCLSHRGMQLPSVLEVYLLPHKSNLPVTLLNSSRICSLVLLLGIEPTKSLLLATEMQTPMCFPERIS